MYTVPLSDTLAIPSELDRIEDARRWAGRHARSAGLDEGAVFDLELALTEAAANVIEHAYGGDGGQTIDLSLTIDERTVELSLLDRGRPFRASEYRPPDLDVPGEGNYGLHLIGQLVDEVHRSARPGGGTVLSLVKYRSEEPHG